MQPVLQWENVSFAYDGRFEINALSYVIEQGDFTLFFGPNGAGKTTLFKLAVGLLKPAIGRVVLGERPLSEWKTLEIAKYVAYLEQEAQYIFPFTVEEIVLMGRFPHTASQFWDRKEDLEVVAWAMEITGILRFAKRSIFQLSSGERRKVEIARALCQKPKILLLDEPTNFLDVRQQVELFETLERLNREERITIGVISHQLSLAKNFVKSAIFIQGGSVGSAGPPEAMLTPEKMSEFFGLNVSKVSVL
ncbi:MAG: ABC transporter ATP-binding protein [Candidatus Omnitrophica bacterium]|nr:ABC transporter ATP-binding protein [Candidatus Omnitrophota bacterium]